MSLAMMCVRYSRCDGRHRQSRGTASGSLYSIAHRARSRTSCPFRPSPVPSGTAVAAWSHYHRTMPFAAAPLLVDSDRVASPSTIGAPMTPALADQSDTDERWVAWRARGATSDRRTALTMHRAFIAIILVLSGWLVFQLLA